VTFLISDELLERAIEFHGHLGPFLVLGLKMGLIAKERLKPEGIHTLQATIKTKLRTPYSCVIDGIQVASSCTLGKNNIKIIEDVNIIESEFESKIITIKIKVKDKIIKKIISRNLKRNSPEMIKFSEKLRKIKNSDLFEIKEF